MTRIYKQSLIYTTCTIPTPLFEACSGFRAVSVNFTMTIDELVPCPWRPSLLGELRRPYIHELDRFLLAERATHTVFPPERETFAALETTSPENVNAVLLGQDPYHDVGQAHGLCFSVRDGMKAPPSLVNIFKELNADMGLPIPHSGNLTPWARQGVLLLNTVLTVRAHEANSHKGKGWEHLTDAIIAAVDAGPRPAVFVLWGNHAARKRGLIDGTRHVIIESAHPSPLSAHRGFFGSRPFSAINAALAKFGRAPIDWRIEG